MSTIRVPRTVKTATGLLERYAAVDAQIAAIEADRSARIAAVNADADRQADPLLKERDKVREALSAWWAEAGPSMTDGKRKSIALGGCMIGSRKGTAGLVLAQPEDEVVKALLKHDWADPLLRRKVTLDRRAVLMSIDGVYAKVLRKLGLSRRDPGEAFFVERVEQAGSLTGAGQ